MALIHDDAKNPKIIYRVENDRGETPYRYKGRSHGVNLGQGQTWPPSSDFEEHPKEFSSGKLLYGFERPADAADWFGEEALDELQNRGWGIAAVPASKVYRSSTGSQVMFEPHPTYHPGKHPTVNWRHEELGLPLPKQPNLGPRNPRKKLPTMGKSEDLSKAPFHDDSWGSGASQRYVSDLRGFKKEHTLEERS